MSYTASLIDGTTVEIVDKVADQARGSFLVDAEGNRYVASKHGDYITPVEVADAVAEVEAEEPQTEEPKTEEPVPAPVEPTEEKKEEEVAEEQ